MHQLRVAGDDRVGRLLEGEHDVQPHRVLAAGADVARLHDAAGRAGDDQPLPLGHRLAEFDRLLVGRRIGRRAGRAEHRHFAFGPIRAKTLNA